jgi:hypothetical protein
MLWTMRAVFAAVLTFEILNWIGLLHFKLTFSWFGLIATAAAAWAITELLWRKLRHLHARAKAWLLFLILASLLIDLSGDVCGWYAAFLWYDQFAHLIGGMAAAMAVVILLRAANLLPDISIQPHLPFWVQLLIVVSIAVLLGVLYELEEYAETVFLGNNRLGDMLDTPNDLFLDLSGALIGGWMTLKNVHQPVWRFLQKLVFWKR